jgi:hypothetical protein
MEQPFLRVYMLHINRARLYMRPKAHCQNGPYINTYSNNFFCIFLGIACSGIRLCRGELVHSGGIVFWHHLSRWNWQQQTILKTWNFKPEP